MTTTPDPTTPPVPSTTTMPAIDITTVVIQAAAAIAGAEALITPFARNDAAIQAATTLLHVTVGNLNGLVMDVNDGITR